MPFAAEGVISRHRLPHPFRWALAALWLAPIFLLALALLLGHGLTAALLDPRLLVTALILALPAVYIWHEGVDVVEGGIVTRMHWPRYYRYDHLREWRVNCEQHGPILTVWDRDGCKALTCLTAHLTDLPILLAALETHLKSSAYREPCDSVSASS